MAKPDWNSIKSEYITTDISYRSLAEKRGVSWRTLAERARREGWPDERKRYCNTVVVKTVQKTATKTSSANARKLDRLQQAADSMGEVIAEIFSDAEQFHRHIIQTRDGDTWDADCRTMDKVDTKAIKDLTGALKDLACVMRSVYDLPTVQERSAMDIAAERLRLDKSKAAAAAAEDGGDSDTGVVELAPVLEDDDAQT